MDLLRGVQVLARASLAPLPETREPNGERYQEVPATCIAAALEQPSEEEP